MSVKKAAYCINERLKIREINKQKKNQQNPAFTLHLGYYYAPACFTLKVYTNAAKQKGLFWDMLLCHINSWTLRTENEAPLHWWNFVFMLRNANPALVSNRACWGTVSKPTGSAPPWLRSVQMSFPRTPLATQVISTWLAPSAKPHLLKRQKILHLFANKT